MPRTPDDAVTSVVNAATGQGVLTLVAAPGAHQAIRLRGLLISWGAIAAAVANEVDFGVFVTIGTVSSNVLPGSLWADVAPVAGAEGVLVAPLPAEGLLVDENTPVQSVVTPAFNAGSINFQVVYSIESL